ncbi:MAG: hypothetical protein MJE77_45230 [Proteobacteria bacterium]|nr:hypothetical protein [Pseudomonadota bacterium]
MSEPRARNDLVKFLANAFDVEELQRWIRDNFDNAIAAQIPGNSSRAGLASDAVDVFLQHGRIDPEFFAKLIAARSGRKAEIRQLERMWPSGTPAPNKAGEVPLSRRPTHDFRLGILLHRTQNTLEVRYQLPHGNPSEPRVMRWAKLAKPLGNASKALDRHSLDKGRSQIGTDLFRVLLGEQVDWGPLLRAIFVQPAANHPQPKPSYHGVRVAICTDDPLLVSLPWRLTSYQERPLITDGWRFSITRDPEPFGDYTMNPPAPVIVVAPRAGTAGQPAANSEHAEAIAEILAAMWPGSARQGDYLLRANTRQQLDNALRGCERNRAILYVYTRVGQHRGRPCLLLDRNADATNGPDHLAIEDLARLVENFTPNLVYLNTSGTALVDPLAHVRIPLVLWRRLPDWAERPGDLAVAWLRRWLDQKGDADPLDALHNVCKNDLTCPEAATLGARSAYRTWNTHRRARLARSGSPALLLDRDVLKALIVKHLRELARSPRRRILAIVAHAEPGNRVADLSSQLRHELDIQGESVVAVQSRRVAFPAQRYQLDVDLLDHLQHDLKADPGEPIAHLLRRHSPHVRGEVRRVLWLDWGTCGEGFDQPALKAVELRAWLQFGSQFLAANCPDDLRVVAYLAIETARSKKIAALIKDERKQPWARKPELWLEEMRPDRVSEEHLLNYLGNHTQCDPHLHVELAELLDEECNGDFASTVARLEPAAASESWLALIGDLRRKLGKKAPSQPDDDETL